MTKAVFYLAKTGTSKRTFTVDDAIIEMLKPFKIMVRSITTDNVMKLAANERIAESLGTDVYYTDLNRTGKFGGVFV